MSRDPFPYDGPIARIDGTRPFNRYLWPMHGDDFWPGHDHSDPRLRSLGGLYRFSTVALADGRWSTCGFVSSIESGTDHYGLPCLYQTRTAALRASAARMIRQIRCARHETHPAIKVSHETAATAITWTFAVIARETGTEARIPDLFPVVLPEPPKPQMRPGLPLFDGALT